MTRRERAEALTSHYYCEDTWYSCPLAEDGCADDSQKGCNCGFEGRADAIEAALREEGALTATDLEFKLGAGLHPHPEELEAKGGRAKFYQTHIKHAWKQAAHIAARVAMHHAAAIREGKDDE